MAMVLYAQNVGGMMVPIELPCDATARDLHEAVGSAFGIRHFGVMHQGVRMTVDNIELADLSVCPETIVQVVPAPPFDPSQEQYEKGDELAHGAYADVWLCETARRGVLVVKEMALMKCYQGYDMAAQKKANERMTEAAQKEFEVMKDFGYHPNLVEVHAVCYEKGFRIFMERCTESLATKLQRMERLSVPVVRKYMKDLFEGLAVLHRHGMTHRCIKPSNLLIDDDTDTLKISDYGCARRLREMQTAERARRNWTETPSELPFWMAPGLLAGEVEATEKSDVWAGGIAGLQMLGRKPWNCRSLISLMFKIEGGAPDGMPKAGETDGLLVALLHRCFEREAEDRPCALELLQHPFFTQ